MYTTIVLLLRLPLPLPLLLLQLLLLHTTPTSTSHQVSQPENTLNHPSLWSHFYHESNLHRDRKSHQLIVQAKEKSWWRRAVPLPFLTSASDHRAFTDYEAYLVLDLGLHLLGHRAHCWPSSGSSPGGAWGNMRDAGNWLWGGRKQGKSLTCCTISLAPSTAILG